MVTYVWNNLSVYPNPNGSGHLSRTALLEGHTRQFDLSILRAFGTECYWMLTLQKKRGRKQAMPQGKCRGAHRHRRQHAMI